MVQHASIQRIRGDIREMKTDPSDQYYAAPLEENMFDWHFTIRGPPGTAFEGGIYHGKYMMALAIIYRPSKLMIDDDE